MKIYDLWRNAQRRAAQGRYDDAVARVYRLLEWSAQWLLREASGIETVDVPVDKIPAGISLSQNREGKYQAGLFNAWALAAEYSGERVAAFWSGEKEHMLDHLQARNHSILAHGFAPLKKASWQRFSDWIEKNLLPMLIEITTEQPYRLRELPVQLPRSFDL
jgi:CRISPR-associated protein (TIGR02710 family)